MDPYFIRQIIILVVLLILSALFSSAETSLTTVSRHKMRGLAESGNKKAKRVLKLFEKQDKMLSAILICNNIVNLAASSLTTTMAIRLAASAGFGMKEATLVGICTGLLTFAIILFGEITPKNIASRRCETLALMYAAPIQGITWVLTPIIFLVNAISHGICRLFGIKKDESREMTELELRTIVDVSQEKGVIEEEEKEIIHNVFDFGDSVAKDIMLPRIEMTFASVDMTYDQLVAIFLDEKYSRLPVYEETVDNVVGILYLKDLFFYKETHKDEPFDIHKVMREAYFTYEFQKTSVLMEDMRKHSITFAIVVDEYGVVAGLITLEDLIEEIVGDIKDEFDESEEEVVKCLGRGLYEVEGSLNLDDLEDKTGICIQSEDYDSIGGHMIELLDHIPEEGESVRERNITYSIKKMEGNRILLVGIQVDPDTDDPEDGD